MVKFTWRDDSIASSFMPVMLDSMSHYFLGRSFSSFEIRSRYFFFNPSPLLPGIYQRCNACATLASILINWNKKRMTSSDGGRELVSIESTSNEPSEILRTDVRTKWATMKKEIRTAWRRISAHLNFCQEKENFELVKRLLDDSI